MWSLTASPKAVVVLRYGITGVFGALLQIIVLWIGVSVLGLREYYLWIVAFGFCLALATTFPLQKYWTFEDGAHHKAPRQFFWYTIIALCSLGANTFLLREARYFIEGLHIDFFHVWYVCAEALILVIVAGTSFVFNILLTFNQKKNDTIVAETGTDFL